MPHLDVSSILYDPMLTDTFTVLRRLDLVDATTGRTKPTVAQTYEGVCGVVSQDPRDLQRGSDGQLMPRSISIDTVFLIQGPTVGKHPDLIVYRGTRYVVKSVAANPQFGVGAYSVDAESIDQPDLETWG